MTECDHSDNGPCTGSTHGTFTPRGTNLTLCRRHRNVWRREHGKHVAETSRPRYPDGEAIPGLDVEHQ